MKRYKVASICVILILVSISCGCIAQGADRFIGVWEVVDIQEPMASMIESLMDITLLNLDPRVLFTFYRDNSLRLQLYYSIGYYQEVFGSYEVIDTYLLITPENNPSGVITFYYEFLNANTLYLTDPTYGDRLELHKVN